LKTKTPNCLKKNHYYPGKNLSYVFFSYYALKPGGHNSVSLECESEKVFILMPDGHALFLDEKYAKIKR